MQIGVIADRNQTDRPTNIFIHRASLHPTNLEFLCQKLRNSSSIPQRTSTIKTTQQQHNNTHSFSIGSLPFQPIDSHRRHRPLFLFRERNCCLSTHIKSLERAAVSGICFLSLPLLGQPQQQRISSSSTRVFVSKEKIKLNTKPQTYFVAS